MIVTCMSLEREHRTLSRMFVIVSSSCLLACENAVSSEAGRAEGNIGVISFLNSITGDGISGANQPTVFVAISCRLRPAQENACSRDYLFFFPLLIG